MVSSYLIWKQDPIITKDHLILPLNSTKRIRLEVCIDIHIEIS